MTVTTSTSNTSQAQQTNQNQSELVAEMSRIKAMASLLGSQEFMLMTLMLVNESGTKVTADQFKYFTGPVVFGRPNNHGTGWEMPREIVGRLIKAAKLDRFCLILDEISGVTKPGQSCSPVELVCAIKPYTEVAPLPQNLAAICTNAFADSIETHPELFPGVDVEQFRIPISDEYERRDLQLTIRRKVTSLGNNPSITGAGSSQSEAEPETETQAQTEPGTVQMKLF